METGVLFIILIVLPIIMALVVNKFFRKLLFIVPILEFGVVLLYDVISGSGCGGVNFGMMFLIIGTTIAIMSTLILLATKKEYVLLIIVGFFMLYYFLK